MIILTLVLLFPYLVRRAPASAHPEEQQAVESARAEPDPARGGTTEVTYQYVVVFNPEGGFVSGGGWITSPLGAFAADKTLTGKATFGFVSKYEKGATVPSGSTEFQFHVAGFRFKSTSYDWLVVGGAKAQFKGSGTVSGQSGFGFLLSVVDGQLNGGGGIDKFRIKVWDRATSAVVYDNLLDALEDATTTTAIGGGSIVIHKP